jgi:2-iminobutanoate/2-iminopropanoate deaminase
MPEPTRREYRVPGLSEPVSHYTDVVVAGGLAFISGMVALDASGSVVGARDPIAQARQTLANLGKCLDAVGATPSDVCKVTVYLTDIHNRQSVNTARREFFGDTRPASTLVQVSALISPELLVEIDAIAVIPT